jgi:cation:H+ antiporter
MTLLLLVAGLVALVVGAEVLVRGASAIALGLGIPSLVVGLTVVAIGTSAPELAVSVGAALAGEASIAAGNVVGSNVFNVLVILGLSALVVPLAVLRRVVRVEVPIMVAFSFALLALGVDGRYGRGDGILLMLALAAFLAFTMRAARRERSGGEDAADAPRRPRGWLLAVGAVAVGLVLLVVGSSWFVDGAVRLATAFGVSPLVIGLTVVAAGTSLPEVVTSLVAALRGARDIAVGNVVGSNIFNIGGVLGLASVVAPVGIDAPSSLLAVDVPIAVAVALLCLPIAFTRGRIDRWEGALFLALYVLYVVYLVLAATRPGAADAVAAVTHWGVVPALAMLLTLSVARDVRRGRGRAER